MTFSFFLALMGQNAQVTILENSEYMNTDMCGQHAKDGIFVSFLAENLMSWSVSMNQSTSIFASDQHPTDLKHVDFSGPRKASFETSGDSEGHVLVTKWL